MLGHITEKQKMEAFQPEQPHHAPRQERTQPPPPRRPQPLPQGNYVLPMPYPRGIIPPPPRRRKKDSKLMYIGMCLLFVLVVLLTLGVVTFIYTIVIQSPRLRMRSLYMPSFRVTPKSTITAQWNSTVEFENVSYMMEVEFCDVNLKLEYNGHVIGESNSGEFTVTSNDYFHLKADFSVHSQNSSEAQNWEKEMVQQWKKDMKRKLGPFLIQVTTNAKVILGGFRILHMPMDVKCKGMSIETGRCADCGGAWKGTEFHCNSFLWR